VAIYACLTVRHVYSVRTRGEIQVTNCRNFCSVCLEDIVIIIFEELDPVWLKGMWDGDDGTHHNMMEILHLIYLKTTP
jgi:hypothetical protein